MVVISLLTPEQLKTNLRKLQSEAMGFVKNVVEGCNPEVVLAVERRGLAFLSSILETRLDYLENVELRTIKLNQLERTVEINSRGIENRRLLVFDDMSDSGRMAMAALKSAKKFSSKVNLAIFCISRIVREQIHNNMYLGTPINYSRSLETEKELPINVEILNRYYEMQNFPLDMSCVHICGSFDPPLSRPIIKKVAKKLDASWNHPTRSLYKMYCTPRSNPQTGHWVKLFLRTDGKLRGFGYFSDLPMHFCSKCSWTKRCQEVDALTECNSGLSSELENELVGVLEKIAKESGSSYRVSPSDQLLTKMTLSLANRTRVAYD